MMKNAMKNPLVVLLWLPLAASLLAKTPHSAIAAVGQHVTYVNMRLAAE